jgi:histidinol-phosphatase (PHP family)
MARRNYVDYHNHTVLCHHAWGTVDEYLERADALGFAEFGFAEHSYWMKALGSRRLCPTREEMDTYLGWIGERRARYDGRDGRMMLRLGLEADWVPDRVEEGMAFIASHPFDHVIGSVHHMVDPCTGEWVPSWAFHGTDLDLVYRAYFEQVAQLAESGMCDILAHLDVILRSGKAPEGGALPYVEEILPRLKASDVAVEINASGLDHTQVDFFPGKAVLGRLVAAGIPITFGSDGHRPEQVGRHAERVVAALIEAGATEYARFDRRERIMTPLEPLAPSVS